jgi:S-(hydroxymethyl)glutathione dehydrogenase/alcohol dehydrogenase
VPCTYFVGRILDLIKQGRFDATDIINPRLPLDQGEHAYEIFDAKMDNCIRWF